MRDCFLQRRKDIVRGRDHFLGNKAVQVVAEFHIDSTVPDPADPYVDLGIVDLLEFACGIHTLSFVQEGSKARPIIVARWTSMWFSMALPDQSRPDSSR